MNLSPTSLIGRHHKITNITLSPTSLSQPTSFFSWIMVSRYCLVKSKATVFNLFETPKTLYVIILDMGQSLGQFLRVCQC